VPSRRLNVLCALLVLLFIVTDVLPALAPVDGEKETPSAVGLGGAQGPVNTPYFVRTTSTAAIATGTIDPKVINESSPETEIVSPGPTFPRRTLTRVGRFSMTLLAPITVTRIDRCVIWVKGREPVVAAHFRVFFLKGSSTIATLTTPSQNLDTNPISIECTDIPTINAIGFNAGDTMGIEIQYTAQSRRYIGPAPDCIVLANSAAHPTRIEVATQPLMMNVTLPVVEKNQVLFSGQILDSAGTKDPLAELNTKLTIVPSTGASAKVSPKDVRIITTTETVVNSYNGWIINYTWAFRKSRATDGTYEFKLDCSYGVAGVNYTNSTFFDLQFPKEAAKTSFFKKTSNLAATGGLIAAIAIIAVVFVWRRRTAYPRYARAYGGRPPRGYYGRPAPPPARPPKPPKVSRWGRKGKERSVMAKGAMAPQGAPPPRGMPPQRRPEGRAPPSPQGPIRGPMPAGMPAAAAARPPPRTPEGRPMPPPARGQMPPGRPMGARPPQWAPNGRPAPPQGAPRRGPPPQGAPRRGPPPQMGPDGRPMRPRGPPPRGARPPPPRGQAPPPREGDPRAVARRRAP
jgi:hypothetical protein